MSETMPELTIESVLEEQKDDLTETVVVFLLDDQARVLLPRRKREFGKDFHAGVGGKKEIKLDENKNPLKDENDEEIWETDEEASIRETRQEIGVKINNLIPMGKATFLFPSKPKYSQKVSIFISHNDDWEGKPVESDEMNPKDCWFNDNELKEILESELAWPDNKLWVPLVVNGDTVNLIVLYNRDGKSILDYRFE